MDYVENFFRDLVVALIQVTLFSLCIVISLIIYVGLIFHDLVSRIISSWKKMTRNCISTQSNHAIRTMSSPSSRVAPSRLKKQTDIEVLAPLIHAVESKNFDGTFSVIKVSKDRTTMGGPLELAAIPPPNPRRFMQKLCNAIASATPRDLTPEDVRSLEPLGFEDVDHLEFWQESKRMIHKIPKELEILHGGTPSEIRGIVESWLIRAHKLRCGYENTANKSRPLESSVFDCSDLYCITSNPWASHCVDKSEVSKERNNSACSGTTLASESSLAASKGSEKSSYTSIDTNPASYSWKETLSVDANKVVPGTMGFPSSAFVETLAGLSGKHTKSHRSFIFRKNNLRSKKSPKPEKQPLQECASCFDEVTKAKAVGLDCQHSYCRECFSRLVSTAIVNEELFPPQCCLINVPEKTITKNVECTVLGAYRRAVKEYGVPAEDRWFCANPKCAKWFDASKYDKKDHNLKCPSCKIRMCRICRGLSHKNEEDCPPNKDLEATLETVHLQGWVRCRKCHAAIEKKEGCLHMTCRCKAEFW